MNKPDLSFKPILTVGLKKGIIYSTIFAFINTGWFVVLVSAVSNESTLDIFSQRSTFEYYGFILTSIFVDVILTVLAFIFIGFPVMILPAVLSSGFLSYWLYSDLNNSKLSLSQSRFKGALLGGLSGLMPGLIFFYGNAIQANPLILAIHYESPQDFLYGIGLFVLPLIFGGLAGFLLGTYLTKKLNGNLDQLDT